MLFRRRKQSDFSAEIEAHIAIEADRLHSEGMGRQDAEATARRAFGNPTAAGERFYESRHWLWWDEIRKDARYAFRALRNSPAFTIAALATLALGIGANTAIFSVIDAALLRPLPYPDPARLALVYGRYPNGSTSSLAPADFLDFRAQSRSFENLSAYRSTAFSLTGRDRPERVEGAVITPDFFAVFGVKAQIGRTLTPEGDAPGRPRTAVLSYALWQRNYAGSPDTLGRTICSTANPEPS